MINEESILELHPLSSRPEGDEEILIGRMDTGDYIVLPSVARIVIDELNSGKTIREADQSIEEKLGEKVDVSSFIEDVLQEYGFIYKIDGNIISDRVSNKRIFPFFTDGVSKFFFNRYTLSGFLICFVIAILICILNHTYVPVYSDIFFSESYTTSLIGTTIASWTFLFLHEIAHLMAARSSGMDSRFSISHRLVFLVVETDMSNIVLLDKRYRYKALLAGLALDGFFLGIGIFIISLNDWFSFGFPVYLTGIIRMLNVVLVLRMAFQFLFFMKTDIYYVFTNLFNCRNLLHNTRLYVYQIIPKLKTRLEEEWKLVDEHEKKIVKWYAYFFILGSVLAVYLFAMYILPQTFTIISGTIQNITKYSITTAPFWDGIILIVMMLIPLVLLCYSWLRSYRTRKLQNA
ncbi:PqqD family protein [Ornithinibacillus xuwenensis]|uniref:PqqD family protein n=1 Tax=Ornithinibacillus xuwenensis TaxID=3144668 RepID=A0ABU9XGV6_9BACI